MEKESQSHPRRFSIFRNWISLAGLVVLAGSFFAFVFLFVIDLLAPIQNPYLGILAYLVAPFFSTIGVFLILVGLVIQRRHMARSKAHRPAPLLMVDLSRTRDRRNLFFFVGGSVLFMLITAVGSYQSYHFTESTQFCGKSCHTVMEPEYTTYLHSPHARVACSECHIGPGAAWYVKAKISGTYQVYATAFHKYQTPIKTPIRNLRPAQDTCEQCHWPKKFVGNLDVTYAHFLPDETNTTYSVRLLLKVGGGDPTHGPVGGIHWHMNVAHKVEFIADDEQRQTIPWVRVTDPNGKAIEFKTPDFKDVPGKHQIRTMDCMDCHNRPTHIFKSPNQAVDLSLALGRMNPSMPNIKKNGVEILAKTYETREAAMREIDEGMRARYTNDVRVANAVTELQQIYRDNFFPAMKSNWRVYPSNLGHMEWPGCFRCHDGEHVSADGKQKINAQCNACHIILAQGSGAQLDKLNAQGHPFNHPGGELGDQKCSECHTGE